MFLPSFSNRSAISFARYACMSRDSLQNNLRRLGQLFCESSGVSEAKYCNAERESERKTAFWGVSFPQLQSLCRIVECQEFRFVVEHRLPPGFDRETEGNPVFLMKTPHPPFRMAFSADPSEQMWVQVVVAG